MGKFSSFPRRWFTIGAFHIAFPFRRKIFVAFRHNTSDIRTAIFEISLFPESVGAGPFGALVGMAVFRAYNNRRRG